AEILFRAVHDLRNPIAVLRATLEWLAEEIGATGETAEAVGDAAAATHRLARIADDLEILARLEHGVRRTTETALAPIVAAAIAADATRPVTSDVPAALAAAIDIPLVTRAIDALVSAARRAAKPGP